MTAAMWQSTASGWAEHADYVDARAAHVTRRLLELTRPGPDDRVLELACGAGGVGLAAAEVAGEVVVSDVAPAMVAIAAERARVRSLDNVHALPRELLAQAPFEDVRIEELAVPARAPSFEEWWTRTTALAGPLAQLLRSLPEDAIRERARAA